MNISRRDFIRLAGVTSLGAALAACKTKVVKETQIVKETVPPQVIKETVAPQVIKETVAPEVVKQTVVAKETVVVEVTPTPPPVLKESPMLAELVTQGKLPLLKDRLPENPLVIPEISEVGQYGGMLHLYAPTLNDFNDLHWVRVNCWVRSATDTYFSKGENGFVPHRAESVTQNADMTEFVVKLRKGMKWSDGEPVTSDDIMFTVNDMWHNEELNFWWSFWAKDVTATQVDQYTVKFTFPTPHKEFMVYISVFASNQGLCCAESPSHYLKQFHIKYNPDADKNAKAAGYDNWAKMFADKMSSYSGQTNLDLPTINMWKLKNKTTTQAIYERNPYYWAVDSNGNQLPYIDGFVVDAVSDIEVAKLKLIAGDFDIAGTALIELKDYPLLKKNEQNGKYLLVLNKGTTIASPYLAPNLNHKDPVLRELFNKPDFRKALSYAINRDEINQICFLGLGKPMQDVYTTWVYVDPTKWLTAYTEFNPDKAKQLLDGLGMKKDASGNYLRSDGAPLTINLQAITELGFGSQVELVAKYWSDIGIKTQYSPIARDLFSQRDNANELDVFIWIDQLPTEYGYNTYQWGAWQLNEKAWNWYYWFTSKGTDPKGEEPPAEWKTYIENVVAMLAATYGSDEYKALVEKVWNFRVIDQLSQIGTVGDSPASLLVKWDIGNVGNHDVPFNSWMGQYPEQWYWKDATHRAEKVP